MDVRKQLIKLLYKPFLQHKIDKLSDTGDIADHLIANGVTVQEWISVTERLPEEDYTFVLVLVETWKRTVGVALYAEHGFYNPLAENTPMNVTHWMPLPNPPKGE